MKKLSRAVDKAATDPMPSFSDAWYDRANNEVLVGPALATIMPGVRDEEVDDAVAYGAGFLGHEISHAFDSEGRHYDADGNKADWWTITDDSSFRERARVMIDEYNQFMPLEGLHVNGERSLAENMADLVGLRVALDAFKKTEQFRRNERIGGFTPLQRFFLAYAYDHAAHERKEVLARRLRNGAYAPDRERVNGVVMNIPEFAEAFRVKPGDRMYRPESARVKIW
jgi:putative endopeptidase